MTIRFPLNPIFGRLAPRSAAVKSATAAVDSPDSPDSLDASDVWLTPANGRVVFDERGKTTWQWPEADDPFASQSSASDFDAANLSIIEPSEIRRSQRPWLHESERTGRTMRLEKPAYGTPTPAVRKR
jgi:hypothetical protein